MEPREFICEDCKSHVFSYNGDPEATLCHMCSYIRKMKLTLDREAVLRKVLDCEIIGSCETSSQEPMKEEPPSE
jgi:hypothetical protein